MPRFHLMKAQRPRRRWMVLACCLLLAPGALAAEGFLTYERAMVDYRLGHYDAAYKKLLHLAGRGDQQAQFRLGVMLHQGRGVPQDFREAMKWYRRAAETNHGGAQNNLGSMYLKGEGVPVDQVKAYMWFTLSASQFNLKGKENRNRLAAILTPEEIMDAQTQATHTARQISEHMDKQPPPRVSRTPQPPPEELPPAQQPVVSEEGVGGSIATPTPPAAPAGQEPEDYEEGYFVQVGSFSNQANLEVVKQKLLRAGFPYTTYTVEKDDQLLHRVNLGPYPSRAEAERIAAYVDPLLDVKSIVRADEPPR